MMVSKEEKKTNLHTENFVCGKTKEAPKQEKCAMVKI